MAHCCGSDHDATAPPPAQVVLVVGTSCHLCEEAREELEELAADFPLEIRVVGRDTPEGQEVFRRHRAALIPVALLDGELFSSGRLPRKKLRKLLSERR